MSRLKALVLGMVRAVRGGKTRCSWASSVRRIAEHPARTASRWSTMKSWAVAARMMQDIAKAYAAEHGIPKVFDTYAELLSEPSIDAVYVPLAQLTHAKWAIAAVQSGKHVLCEKPLASNAQQAADVVAAATACGKLMVEALRALALSPGVQSTCSNSDARSRRSPSRRRSASPSRPRRRALRPRAGRRSADGPGVLLRPHAANSSPPSATVLEAEGVEGPRGIDVSMTASFRFPRNVGAGCCPCFDGRRDRVARVDVCTGPRSRTATWRF